MKVLVCRLLMVLLGFSTAVVSEEWGGSLSLGLDNDIIVGHDDYYTSSGFLTWVSQPLIESGRWLPGLADASVRTAHLNLQQATFTPRDTLSESAPTDDLPYSSQLFARLSMVGQDERTLHAWSAAVGVIGPAGGGQRLQETVHDLRGKGEPRGWEDQIDNGPLLNLGYQYRYRWWQERSHAWIHHDAHVGLVAEAGNLISQAGVGLQYRIGAFLPDDHRMTAPFFGDRSVGDVPVNGDPDRTRYHGYLTVWTSALAYAAFMDGTLGDDEPSIDHDPLLVIITLGHRLQWRRWSLDLAMEVTRPPWDGARRDWDVYGRMVLGYELE